MKKKAKKIVALCLAVTMLIGSTITANAEGLSSNETPAETTTTEISTEEVEESTETTAETEDPEETSETTEETSENSEEETTVPDIITESSEEETSELIGAEQSFSPGKDFSQVSDKSIKLDIPTNQPQIIMEDIKQLPSNKMLRSKSLNTNKLLGSRYCIS